MWERDRLAGDGGMAGDSFAECAALIASRLAPTLIFVGRGIGYGADYLWE